MCQNGMKLKLDACFGKSGIKTDTNTLDYYSQDFKKVSTRLFRFGFIFDFPLLYF